MKHLVYKRLKSAFLYEKFKVAENRDLKYSLLKRSSKSDRSISGAAITIHTALSNPAGLHSLDSPRIINYLLISAGQIKEA